MLKIKKLSAKIGDKQILKNVNIELPAGKCLLVTGQNGAGKSTLLHAIMGRSDIKTTGTISLEKTALHKLECHERAQAGVFLAHQAPPTIDGVNTMTLFKEVQKAQSLDITTGDLIKKVKALTEDFALPTDWGKRSFNSGASGGERKKGELMQAKVLLDKTKLLLLDEPDSGLEQSSRKKIVKLINDTCNAGGSVMLVTHDKELQKLYQDNKLDLSNVE
jgi:Fe-S cluster assembly ATP-binding protein